MAAHFRLLGRLEIDHGGKLVVPGRRRERCLLGVLLLQPGAVVPIDRLLDLLWDDPPATAKASLRTHVTRLRAGIDPGGTGRMGLRLRSDNRGYVADVEPSAVDAHVFTAEVAHARALTDPVVRAGRLRQALALWRGPLLADDATERLRDRIGSQLAELRLTATILAVEAELECGRHLELTAELTALTAEHPHREQFVGQLMLALYRAGRHAEALDAYQRARVRLADDLGVDPGPELQRLHTAMLRGEVAVPASRAAAKPAEPAVPAAAASVPRQLPADIASFVGREDALRRLDGRLPARSPGNNTHGGVGISVITGGPGVGKTALAVHWAHAVADRFPDGQLYIDLRGYSPDRPLDPAEALHRFLFAFDAPTPRGPADVEALSAAYRSLLADRRVLVLLDNAVDAAQVRPLIPASPGCLVVVTARDDLRGLVALDDAQPLPVEVFTPEESLRLLSHILGEQRIAEESRDAVDLAVLCGHLPLALRIAAAHLAQAPLPAIGDLVKALTTGDRISVLSPGADPKAALRTVFEHSYARLEPAARRLFRLLGLVVGDDIATPAVAALAGLTSAEAQRLLGDLTARQLVGQQTPGRYRMHDLIRLYARELTGVEDDPPARARAIDGLHGHYVSRVDSAVTTLNPAALRLLDPDTPAAPEPAPTDYAEALAWLDNERHNIIAIIHHSAASPHFRTACRLIDALRGYLAMRRHGTDWTSAFRAGLAGAGAAGDRQATAVMQTSLGFMYTVVGDYPAALEHLQAALPLLRELGHGEAEARTLGNLSTVHRILGDIDASLEAATLALDAYRRVGSLRGEAMTLGNLGQAHHDLGELDPAVQNFARSIECFRRCGDREGEANSHNSLGIVHCEMGRFDRAAEHLEKALALFGELGGQHGEIVTRNSLAMLGCELGHAEAALREAQQAASMAHEVGYKRAEADLLNTAAVAARRLGLFDEADRRHADALRLAREIGWKHAEIEALLGLASVTAHPSRSDGERAQTAEHARAALGLARTAGYRLQETRALMAMADIGSCDAVEAYRRVLTMCRKSDQKPVALRVLRRLGRALYRTDPDGAREAWRHARAVAIEIGTPGCYFLPG